MEQQAYRGSARHFDTGQCVTHISQSIPSRVVSCIEASNGRQFYGVQSMARQDDNRSRLICAASLMPADEAACSECSLYGAPACPDY